MSKKDTKPISYLTDYIGKWKGKVISASIFSMLNKIFDIAPEVLIGIAVDLVVKKNDSFVASLGFTSIDSQVAFIGGITFLIWALESLFEYLYMIEWRGLAQRVEHDLRVKTYDHAQLLDLDWHEKQSIGNITAILNDDVNQLERFLNNGVNQIIQISVSTIIIGFIFFFISPLIATIAIIPVPVIFFVSIFFQKKLSPKYKSIREKVGLLNTLIVNNLMGIKVIKSFMTFEIEKLNLGVRSKEYQQENINAIAISSAFNPLIRMGVLSGFLGTMLIGSYMALNGTLEVGSYSVLVFLTQRFLWPFTTLSILIDDFERTMASCGRIFNMLAVPIKIKDRSDSLSPNTNGFDIRFEEVSFHYEKSIPLFKNLNLTIPHGTSIGLVGDTGSGKTTIAKLLLRLYELKNGNIHIGDHSISNLSIKYLREKIGIVSQESFLFDASILDNITYGVKDPGNIDIEQAIEKSQCKEFIEKLPDGLDTIVGERGQILSGGQRQRISIARTLIRKPEIIIFDEATSAVDNRTEQLIQRAIFEIIKERTSIIIAHRLSTIRNCQNILVLNQGKIIEEGTHDALIADQNSYYSKLWNIQTGNLTVE